MGGEERSAKGQDNLFPPRRGVICERPFVKVCWRWSVSARVPSRPSRGRRASRDSESSGSPSRGNGNKFGEAIRLLQLERDLQEIVQLVGLGAIRLRRETFKAKQEGDSL